MDGNKRPLTICKETMIASTIWKPVCRIRIQSQSSLFPSPCSYHRPRILHSLHTAVRRGMTVCVGSLVLLEGKDVGRGGGERKLKCDSQEAGGGAVPGRPGDPGGCWAEGSSSRRLVQVALCVLACLL